MPPWKLKKSSFRLMLARYKKPKLHKCFKVCLAVSFCFSIVAMESKRIQPLGFTSLFKTKSSHYLTGKSQEVVPDEF